MVQVREALFGINAGHPPPPPPSQFPPSRLTASHGELYCYKDADGQLSFWVMDEVWKMVGEGSSHPSLPTLPLSDPIGIPSISFRWLSSLPPCTGPPLLSRTVFNPWSNLATSFQSFHFPWLFLCHWSHECCNKCICNHTSDPTACWNKPPFPPKDIDPNIVSTPSGGAITVDLSAGGPYFCSWKPMASLPTFGPLELKDIWNNM